MYGNTCITLLSQHLLIKALFEYTPERECVDKVLKQWRRKWVSSQTIGNKTGA